jgi:hypothetical protein
MGAILRQVVQVNRKNSISCSSPESRLTLLGSVASRSGPREVAIALGAGTLLGLPETGAGGADAAGVETRVAVVLGSTRTAVADSPRRAAHPAMAEPIKNANTSKRRGSIILNIPFERRPQSGIPYGESVSKVS